MTFALAAISQPWWAIPIVSAGATLLGALIVFVSNRRTTDRQLTRSEQAARRIIYAKWLEVIGTHVERLASLGDAQATIFRLKDEVAKTAPRTSAAHLDDLRARLEAADLELVERRDAVSLTTERATFSYYELLLYAPIPVRDLASAVWNGPAGEIYDAAFDGDVERRRVGRANLAWALAEFIEMARADVGAADAFTANAVVRQIQFLRAQEDADIKPPGSETPCDGQSPGVE